MIPVNPVAEPGRGAYDDSSRFDSGKLWRAFKDAYPNVRIIDERQLHVKKKWC